MFVPLFYPRSLASRTPKLKSSRSSIRPGGVSYRDLRCLPACLPHVQWLVACCASLSAVVGADSLPYGELFDEVVGGMFELHWDGEEEAFFDYGVHMADGELVDEVIMRCQNGASRVSFPGVCLLLAIMRCKKRMSCHECVFFLLLEVFCVIVRCKKGMSCRECVCRFFLFVVFLCDHALQERFVMSPSHFLVLPVIVCCVCLGCSGCLAMALKGFAGRDARPDHPAKKP